MNLWHSPTGKVIKGHVLDVNEKSFNEALRFYDPLLYTNWNPKGLSGWGNWEIRRKEPLKYSVLMGEHKGTKIFKLVDHPGQVLRRMAFLNYDTIRHLIEADLFTYMDRHGIRNNDQLESHMSYVEKQQQAAAMEKTKENLKYAIRQNKSVAKDFYEAVRSGVNPAQILLSTSWAQS